MKRLLLATAACLALSLPAMAQNNSPSTNSAAPAAQQQNQSAKTGMNKAQDQNGAQKEANNEQRQSQEIKPSSLDKREIKQIQMNLDKAGFNAKRADGIWGPETEQALRSFQQKKNLPGNGQLNQQTLAALGVNVANEGRAASESNNGGPAQNGAAGQTQPAANSAPASSGQNSNSQK